MRERLLRAVMERVPGVGRYAEEVGIRKLDPYTAAQQILAETGLSS